VSRPTLPVLIGNDFVLPQAQLQVATPLPAPKPMVSFTSVQVQSVPQRDFIPVSITSTSGSSVFEHALDAMHRYSLGVFALLFLIVASTGIEVGASYWSAHLLNKAEASVAIKPRSRTVAGLNQAIPRSRLNLKLKAITSQPASISVNGQSLTISPETIKSWLQITPNSNGSQSYVRINSDVMVKSITDLASSVIKAPINQVTLTEEGVSRVVIGGQDGTKISNPDALKQQIEAAAKTVMNGSGLNFTTSTETAAFATVGPEAFDKLIDANVTTKQTYFFENGKLVQQYASSDGAPATPTPLGQFHIYSKLASQDMKGYNANGTKYFQPHVHWVNYFLPGGYAVHGVYWHPLSWFGVHNSSHGCVGLPDADAEWVYDWAPIGTTVITHA
jgi:lipoprotein-anchoring transpeptidase ErfK/SrfK